MLSSYAITSPVVGFDGNVMGRNVPSLKGNLLPAIETVSISESRCPKISFICFAMRVYRRLG
jgi:hypothetical protein